VTRESARECGPCQACCELPTVPELKKPMFTRCGNLCAEGCSIYAERPVTCRAFVCAWLRGDAILADEDRPDQLGLMLETCVSERLGEAAIQYVQIWETRRGALDDVDSRALALVEALSERWPIRLQGYQTGTVYLAPPHMEHLADELSRRAKATAVAAEPGDSCPCGSGRVFEACHGGES